MNDACFVNNGGCSPDAFCMDIGGAPACLCKPGFFGNGQTCNTCTACGVGEFASTSCTPTSDAVCSTCGPQCQKGKFESQPCGGNSDRVCTMCSQCPAGFYIDVYCTPAQDTMCAACGANCELCFGPGASCQQCAPGYTLVNGVCNPPMCGNGILEGTEMCDDGNVDPGDGCSDQCMVEAGFYCFGNGPTTCRAGNCVVDPLTALPLTNAFALDGAGTASTAGITFTQRSTIRTAADVAYPILIEADVVYSGNDITFAGARGPGTRDGANADEPTDTLRARLASSGLMQLVEATNTVAQGKQASFTPTPGVTYRIRYVDDGLTASIEWFNVTNPFDGDVLGVQSSFHGAGDRAFIGSDNATMSNLRVCSAEPLPVTSGLVARYSAIPSWTVVRDGLDMVSQWQDTSGSANHLDAMGLGPIFGQGFINNTRPGVSFQGATQLFTAAFPLTTEVTVFAVIHHNTPAQWGAIAHHGRRDTDWSMEQSGDTGDPNTLHWQTNNDNVNVNVTLTSNTDYVMTGRLGNNMRYFSATAFSGTSPTPASFTDASQTITAGNKSLFVGSSDNNEASNAFIGELVYFNRALSDAERDSVIAYLRRLWQP
jgi:cysteine-rich repeat protein